MVEWKKGDDVLVWQPVHECLRRARITSFTDEVTRVVFYSPVGVKAKMGTIPSECIRHYWLDFLGMGTKSLVGAELIFWKFCWGQWLMADMVVPLTTKSGTWQGAPKDLHPDFVVAADGSYVDNHGNYMKTGVPPKSYLVLAEKQVAARQELERQSKKLLMHWCDQASEAANNADVGIHSVVTKAHAQFGTGAPQDARVGLVLDLTTAQHLFELMGVEVAT